MSVAASSSSFWVSAGVTAAGLANSISGYNIRRTNFKLVYCYYTISILLVYWCAPQYSIV